MSAGHTKHLLGLARKSPLKIGDKVLYLGGDGEASRLVPNVVIDVLTIHSTLSGRVRFEYMLSDVFGPVPLEQITGRYVDGVIFPLTDEATASQEVTYGTGAGS